MVQDGEIALAIIEGVLVALPLWLAVLRYSEKDLQLTEEKTNFSKWDEWGTILTVGVATGIGFLSLLGSFMIAATVVVGLRGSIDLALILMGIFMFVVGIQLSAALVNRVSTNHGRNGEIIFLIGLFGGVMIIGWITSLL